MGLRLPLLLIFVSIALVTPAVDCLADSGGKDAGSPAFFAPGLINLPTTGCLDKGEVLVRVSHRFYLPTSSGHRAMYGLDGPAFILLGLSYGVRDDWSVALGRTNLRDEVELSTAFSPFQQGDRLNFPFSAVVRGAVSLTTEVPEGSHVFVRDNVRFSIQASLSRQFTDAISILAVPSFCSNTDYSRPDEENTFGLGLGGRVMVLKNISLVGEIIPVLSGYSTGTDTWGLGVEVKKGGHVFHIFVTNAYGETTNQYLPGGDLKLADGDLRYGFNIYRSF